MVNSLPDLCKTFESSIGPLFTQPSLHCFEGHINIKLRDRFIPAVVVKNAIEFLNPIDTLNFGLASKSLLQIVMSGVQLSPLRRHCQVLELFKSTLTVPPRSFAFQSNLTVPPRSLALEYLPDPIISQSNYLVACLFPKIGQKEEFILSVYNQNDDRKRTIKIGQRKLFYLHNLYAICAPEFRNAHKLEVPEQSIIVINIETMEIISEINLALLAPQFVPSHHNLGAVYENREGLLDLITESGGMIQLDRELRGIRVEMLFDKVLSKTERVLAVRRIRNIKVCVISVDAKGYYLSLNSRGERFPAEDQYLDHPQHVGFALNKIFVIFKATIHIFTENHNRIQLAYTFSNSLPLQASNGKSFPPIGSFIDSPDRDQLLALHRDPIDKGPAAPKRGRKVTTSKRDYLVRWDFSELPDTYDRHNHPDAVLPFGRAVSRRGLPSVGNKTCKFVSGLIAVQYQFRGAGYGRYPRGSNFIYDSLTLQLLGWTNPGMISQNRNQHFYLELASRLEARLATREYGVAKLYRQVIEKPRTVTCYFSPKNEEAPKRSSAVLTRAAPAKKKSRSDPHK